MRVASRKAPGALRRVLVSTLGLAMATSEASSVFFMPEESDHHRGTWLSYVASKDIWGRKHAQNVKKDLQAIARTIAKYEPVYLFANPGDDADYAKDLFYDYANIDVIEQPLNDLWIRDYGAVFVVNEDGGMEGIGFNFNGWGEKQTHSKDSAVANWMAKTTKVPFKRSFLVMEGGGIETDGQGTAILTESCILNLNRNPDVTKEGAEAELKRLLGLQKIIWLPGIKGEEITDGHVDFYVKFIKPGVVVAAWDDDPESFDYSWRRSIRPFAL
eukprot:TRINITY_DN25273_c0_g1_i1.p1 TRINITY_DN25273_c0_g1~~TRINITY_DN25273_c0_g1_i1.p1  ORF type:complete len:272 (-),score=41.45 TRINITY_DN25273_c0_g1_i1:300-1115(-)